jgi:hemolysin activation/secretion protein
MESGSLLNAILTAEARHYWRIDRHQTLYASFTGAVSERLDPDHQLVLGGEEGLRGYPLRYQTGTSSALLTLEQRVYTDWYPFRLFYVGAVAFLDTGRTWGPTLGGEAPRGWLSDAGLGLRFGNSRSGLGSVVHVDFSYALDPVPGKNRFQVIVGTKNSF